MQIYNDKKIIFMSLSIGFFSFLILMLCFPLGAYFLSFCISALVANSKITGEKKLLFFVLVVSLSISIIINENSVQKFMFRDDDFTSYYNNYLDFVNGKYESLFEFGGGGEVGLPVLNYLLSVLISSPLPYVVQSVYILIFIMMLYCLVAIDKQFCINTLANRYMLFLWGLLFFKITAMLTIERQAMASFFVLFALSDFRKRFFWLLIGCFFHVSTPIIYFFVGFILRTKTYTKAILSSVILLGFVFFSYQILTVLNSFFPNDKIGYVLYYLHDSDFIKNEIIKSVKQIIYILPLLILNGLLWLKGVKWGMGPSLLLFSLCMLILSTLPGVPTRLMMPIVFILVGFYYYNFFSLFSNRTHLCAFLFIVFCLTTYKFFLPGYYYRYPVADIYPGYYLDSFMEQYGYTERSSLPGMDDVSIKNENKI